MNFSITPQSKPEMRKEALKLRKQLSLEECKIRGCEIMSKVMSLPWYADASAVMAYMAIRNEVDTAALVSDILATGRELYLPRISKDRKRIEAVRVANPDNDLRPGYFKVMEPIESLAALDVGAISRIDLVIVPGVVFDEQGYRIGYGAGYYDGFIDSLNARTKTVGVCYREQLTEKVPRDPWDRPVDLLVYG